MRKSNLIGGVLLVLFGLVFLASNFGYIEPDYFYRLGQLWPLWLVVGGLLVMARNYHSLRYVAGVVVGLMLLVAYVDPAFLHGMNDYRHGRDGSIWHFSSFGGLLFLAGAVWVLYNLFGRNRHHETR